jgi:hypothetical protein
MRTDKVLSDGVPGVLSAMDGVITPTYVCFFLLCVVCCGVHRIAHTTGTSETTSATSTPPPKKKKGVTINPDRCLLDKAVRAHSIIHGLHDRTPHEERSKWEAWLSFLVFCFLFGLVACNRLTVCSPTQVGRLEAHSVVHSVRM